MSPRTLGVNLGIGIRKPKDVEISAPNATNPLSSTVAVRHNSETSEQLSDRSIEENEEEDDEPAGKWVTGVISGVNADKTYRVILNTVRIDEAGNESVLRCLGSSVQLSQIRLPGPLSRGSRVMVRVSRKSHIGAPSKPPELGVIFHSSSSSSSSSSESGRRHYSVVLDSGEKRDNVAERLLSPSTETKQHHVYRTGANIEVLSAGEEEKDIEPGIVSAYDATTGLFVVLSTFDNLVKTGVQASQLRFPSSDEHIDSTATDVAEPPQPRRVRIRLVSAADLKAADANGKSDPYVKISVVRMNLNLHGYGDVDGDGDSAAEIVESTTVVPRSTHRFRSFGRHTGTVLLKSAPVNVIAEFQSSVRRKTLAPVWEESFEVPEFMEGDRISFDCFDWDKFGSHDFLGHVELIPDEFPYSKEYVLPLAPRPGRREKKITGSLLCYLDNLELEQIPGRATLIGPAEAWKTFFAISRKVDGATATQVQSSSVVRGLQLANAHAQLKGGSLEELVLLLFDPPSQNFNTKEYAETFLLTYTSFTTNAQLIWLLKHFYTHSDNAVFKTCPSAKVFRISMIVFLKKWLGAAKYHFSDAETQEMIAFSRDVVQQLDGDIVSKQLCKILGQPISSIASRLSLLGTASLTLSLATPSSLPTSSPSAQLHSLPSSAQFVELFSPTDSHPKEPRLLDWFEGRTLKIGRSRDCDYTYAHEGVSSLHCEFIFDRKRTGFRVVPFCCDYSSNGTFVNGKLVGKGQRVRLRSNDVITLVFAKPDTPDTRIVGLKFQQRASMSLTASTPASASASTSTSMPAVASSSMSSSLASSALSTPPIASPQRTPTVIFATPEREQQYQVAADRAIEALQAFLALEPSQSAMEAFAARMYELVPPNLSVARFSTNALDPEWLGRNLTMQEQAIFVEIEPSELLATGWTKPDREKLAPNVLKIISYFNRTAGCIANEILTQVELESRVRLIETWISCARYLRSINNFNTTNAILSALGISPIARLSQTWAAVSKKSMQILAELKGIFNPEKNYRNFRAAMATASPPCRPFIGTYLTDLVFIHDGNPDMLKDEPTFINYFKREKTAQTIMQIVRHQLILYEFPEDPHFATRMQRIESLSENEQYAKSYQIEARAQKS